MGNYFLDILYVNCYAQLYKIVLKKVFFSLAIMAISHIYTVIIIVFIFGLVCYKLSLLRMLILNIKCSFNEHMLLSCKAFQFVNNSHKTYNIYTLYTYIIVLHN